MSKKVNNTGTGVNAPSSIKINGTTNGNYSASKLLLDDISAIERFKEFLRFRTITEEMPTTGINYDALKWLTTILESYDLKVKILEYTNKRPILLATWEGSDRTLPSILLNSHYDVVPCDESKWSVSPFDAVEKDDGWIYGRGTQDMKCVCMGYVEAILRLKQHQYQPKRTIHLSFMPDEENSGRRGMGEFVKSADFKELNVGFALDEGLANEGNAYTVFNSERCIWWLHVKATGEAGHGSRFVKDTAMEKLITSINKFLAFRKEQQELLECQHLDGCSHAHAAKRKRKLGDVTTVNLTALSGGHSDGDGKWLLNVIPSQASAGFDIRVPPTQDLEELENKIKEFTNIDGVSYDFHYKVTNQSISSTDPQQNPYWSVFTAVIHSFGKEVDIETFPASTDARYLRELNIPAIGFSPMHHTPILLHDHDERIHRDTYIEGIQVYEKLISRLATETFQ